MQNTNKRARALSGPYLPIFEPFGTSIFYILWFKMWCIFHKSEELFSFISCLFSAVYLLAFQELGKYFASIFALSDNTSDTCRRNNTTPHEKRNFFSSLRTVCSLSYRTPHHRPSDIYGILCSNYEHGRRTCSLD
jgi:hypothetical protein